MNPANNPTTWLNAIWDAEITSTQKLVAAHLRRYMTDDNNSAFPSVKTIAKKCGLSTRTVQRTLQSLVELGYLKKDGLSPYETVVYVTGQVGGDTVTGGDTEYQKPVVNVTQRNHLKNCIYTERFGHFWSAYPRKVAKPAALKAFTALKPSEELTDSLITDCQQRLATGDWCDKQYIPYPATYLNQKRWMDEITPKREQSNGINREGGKSARPLSAVDRVRQATGQH